MCVSSNRCGLAHSHTHVYIYTHVCTDLLRQRLIESLHLRKTAAPSAAATPSFLGGDRLGEEEGPLCRCWLLVVGGVSQCMQGSDHEGWMAVFTPIHPLINTHTHLHVCTCLSVRQRRVVKRFLLPRLRPPVQALDQLPLLLPCVGEIRVCMSACVSYVSVCAVPVPAPPPALPPAVAAAAVRRRRGRGPVCVLGVGRV